MFPPTPAELYLWQSVTKEISVRDRISIEQANENLSSLLASLPPPPQRGDIYPWLEGFYDQRQEVVRVPDGVYTLGGINDHGTIPVNTKRSSITELRAESPGGVVIDLAANGGARLLFGNGVGSLLANLHLSGFRFINGNVTVESVTELRFKHCGHSYKRLELYKQLVSAADKLNFFPTSCDRDPFKDGRNLFGPGNGVGLDATQWKKVAESVSSIFGPLRIEAPNGANQRIGFHGCDIVGSVDDGIFSAGTFYLMVEGCRILDINEYEQGVSCDPGFSMWTPTYEDQYHNDCIQIGMNSYQPTVRDTYIAGRMMWNQPPHPTKRKAVGGKGMELRFERVWSGGQRWTEGSGRGYKSGLIALTENTTDKSEPAVVISSVNPPDWTGVIKDLTYIARNGQPITWVTPESKFTGIVKSNIRQTDLGLVDVFDQMAIAVHSQNPANLWRLAHPYVA